ncbi:deoxyguanosinetriphosphate triphosphohydrolase [Marinivivus vitaminiproducens]|uniref:deoxyguanosinetriphosphate triphosphohydrolase n=1 Tax=Marinivivus vitaminiproducens TaxID=3035935 RepID=UPI0027AAB0E7|nr:deoxyguanosinetriphosphate triphosphohydrolase [Geminicoccaceae bacterium SCSIO 64248]
MAQSLAAFACRAEAGKGRCHPEPESAYRSAFQRDRDRIVHAQAFRRLEYKTQVFVNHEGDHFRTRLTHSLEVSQIARTLARILGIDEDLAEAVALAHDLGHTPFGHAGEEALNEVMAAHGGFDHNVQTFRIVTDLERRYAGFDGLNLTRETLESLIKHNGPVREPVPSAIRAFASCWPMSLDGQGSAEAQAAALSDDIAYTAHDLDDGLRAGLFDFEEVRELPLAGDVLRDLERRHPGLERRRLVQEVIRAIINRLVVDVIEETGRRLRRHAPASPADVHAMPVPLVAFSAELLPDFQAVRAFLHRRMYRHYKVRRMQYKAGDVVRSLFRTLSDRPDCLPDDWQDRHARTPPSSRPRVVADYIAGMTDRFALAEHRRLLDPDTLTR